MVTKMLIQVISVVTLVFGTCYQSVQALASNTKRIDIQSARLIDKDNTAPATVKAGSEHKLVVDLTISNKDGDHESGTTQFWVPEQQLTLLEKKATFEPETMADNARLVYKKLSNNQLQLSWQKVTHSATFKVELPVRVNQAMTETQLPIAVGSATEYLQPLTVLAEEATDDAVTEITGDPGLPGNILANLNQYLTAQQAQEEAEAAAAKQEADAAAQKEAEEQAKADAAAKAEAAKKKAAEDKVKQKAEAKEQAEKAAAVKKEKEQQEATEAKETAKTETTLKARSAKVTEKADDGEDKEGEDKPETKGTDLAQYLKNNEGAKASLFDRVWLTDAKGTTINVENGSQINVADEANFTLHYEWNTKTIRDRLGDQHKLKVNDYYTFKIYGLKIEKDVKNNVIVDKDNIELGRYSIENTGDNEYTVTVKFTSPTIEITTVNYVMDIEQVTIPGDNIDFEYNDGAIWTATPIEEKSLLEKSGQFIGNQEIRWTVKMDTSEAKVGKEIRFDEIVLTDVLKSGAHELKDVKDIKFTARYANDDTPTGDVSGYFDVKIDNDKKLTITGNDGDVVTDNLVFTFVTTYKDSSSAKFENSVKGKIGDNLTLKEVIAATQQNSLRKSYASYNDKDGTYAWQINTTLKLSQYSDTQMIEDLLAGLVITDTVEGAHRFNGSKLNLEMTIDGKNFEYEDWFDVAPEGDVTSNKMTIKVRDNVDMSKLREKLIVGGKDQEIVLTYKTEKYGNGNITNVKNGVSLEFDGQNQTSNAGSGDQYITKSGKLNYHYDKNNATIDWIITVNPNEYAFKTLKVVDVLPERSTEKVEAVIISKDADGKEIETEIGFTKGYVEEYSDNKDTFYKFVGGVSDTERQAIQFDFDRSYSGQAIKIKITTHHAWKDLGTDYAYKNEAGAIFDNNWFGFDDAEVTIQKDIRDNVYKNGNLQLDKTDANPENENNQVEWTVGFGSQLRTIFGHRRNQTNKVQIRDWLNKDDLPYLSFPENEDDYQLYEMKHTWEDKSKKYTFSKDKLVDKEAYQLDIQDDPKSETGKIITITFTNKAIAEGYKHLSLVFATPIDLMAWQQKDSQKEVPNKYEFHNSAVVTYGGKTYEKVSDTVDFDSTNVYGKKNWEEVKGSQITWNVLLNALGKNIGRPTITDKVGAGHIHSPNLGDIELSLVDVDYTEKGEAGFDFAVNTDNQKILERDKDYTVDMTDDVMTIKLITEVDRPLQLRYKTVVKDYQLGSYENKVSLSGKGYSPTFSAKATVTASAWADSFLAAFTKVDGATNKPLAGAKFKLQWDRDDTGVWTDAQNIDGKEYDIVTSNELGQVQFELLGDIPTYRLIEVAPPTGYESSQMAPIEFNKKDYDKLEGHRPVIKNWDVKKADLVIDKSVKNLNKQRFEFEIEAVTVEKSDIEGIEDKITTDTDFNGTYKLENGAEVTFENGVSTKIGIASDEKVTLKNLPVYKATETGKGKKWQFIVREVSESDKYNTLVWLNNEDPVAGKKTTPFKLDENQANSVRVFFENTANTGNLRLNKLVISDTPEYEKDDFVFTITATQGEASVAGKTFKAAGNRYAEVEFNDKGIATVNLRHNENVEILGLPAAVKFKVAEEHHANLTADWSIDNGDYEESKIPEVTIAADKTTLLTYCNSDVPTGQIRLEKLILGDIKANQHFTFTVTPDTQITDGQYTISVFKVGDNQPVRVTTANFAAGEIKVRLRGNQYAMINGLPLKPKYTVSESDPNTNGVKGIETTWETTWETSDDSDDKLTTGKITLENKNTVEPVIFTNALPNGDLKLNKRVFSSYPLDSEKEFEFTIEAKTNDDVERLKNKVYRVENHDLTYLPFNADGQAKLTLRHNQSALIKGLPVGVQVKITENSDANFSASYQVGNDDKEDQDGDGPTVTISDEKTEVVKYENTRHPDGKLHIEKIGKNLTTDEGFEFKIKAKDDDKLTGLYDGVLKQRGDDEATAYEVNFEKGEANIELKAGEYLVIPGLPLGSYIVSEKATDGLATSWTVTDQEDANSDETDAVDGYYEAAPAKVTEKTTPRVVYTNQLITGKLQVNKRVASHLDEDLNAKYDFEITATKNADKVRNKNYEMIINNEQKTLSFSGDTAELTLRHGETALVNGLPVGVELAVKEVLDEDSQLAATWLIGNEGTDYHELTDDNVPEVKIDDSETSVVSYKNTRTPDGELMVKKTIEGNIKKNQSFKFNVQLTAEETTHLSGEYQVQIYDQDKMLTNAPVQVEDDQLTFDLQGGQWAIVMGLPLAKYQVEEVDPEVAGMQTTWTINSGEEQTNAERIATLTKPLTVNGRQVVAFNNLLETGKLQVNKHVASHLDKDLNATYVFDLEVEGNDAVRVNDNTYKVTGNDTQPDLEFKDGKAVLKVQGSGSVVVDGLPTGVTVAVKERIEDNDLEASWLVGIDGDYEVLADDNYPEVEIRAEKDGVVSYKNTRDPDGELKVEKVIKGNIDADKQFNFAVRSTDANAPLDKTYQVRTYDQNGNIVQTRDIEADSGDINIKLTGGHSAIISGLPLKTYQVHESRAGIAHMVTTWTLNHEGNATTGRTATLENALTANGMQTVTFTNEVPEGDLRLEKIAEGTYSATDKIKFTIQASDRLTGKYNGVLYQADTAQEIGKVSVEFNRGWASVSLAPGQYLMISGLPTQRYQVVEERQADDVVTTWKTDTQTGTGRRAAWVATKENHTAGVTFTNRIDVGSLTLNKWVASQHEDDLKAEYKFTLTASGDDIAKVADKEYEVKGHDETTYVKFDENGKAELTMIHDTPVTINGLPVGVELTVTETTIKDFVATWRVNNAGDYVELTDDTQPTITIDDTHTQVVSYKNTRDPEGQLQIEKQVTGAVADEDASYDFIIEALDATTGETTPEDDDGDTTEQPVGDETSTDTETETVTPEEADLLDLNGSYSVLVYQSGTDKLLHKGTVEFDKGQATLALKADQYAVVNGLPLHTYQVREADPEVANMSTSWSVNGGKLTAGLQADAHELTADGVMTVLFNNTVSTGDLSIEKQVTGAVTEADEQQAYDFTVMAYREADDGEVEVDTDYNQQHAATLTAANGSETTIRLDFKSGELAVSLKVGERLTIHNLDENRVVTVTETPLADFITTHRIGTESVTAGNETRQITIGDDVTKHVTFINDKPATPEAAWLSLTKSVLGSAGETDRGFDFTVQLVDHLQQPITGIVKVVKTTATGTYTSGEMLFDDHGTATVTLQHNETVKLEVPNGAHYQIAETDYSADGYVTTISQGGNPERTGLTATGIAHQVDPSTALVVYYNRADSTDSDDELAHTDTEDDQAMPELVGPATDDGSGTGTTGANSQAHTGTGGTGTSGTITPQAYTSGSSKGFLPQTGEFLRAHWVAVLGWLLLMVLIGMMVWRYRLNKR